MRTRSSCVSIVAVLLISSQAWSATHEESIAGLRAALADVGRKEIASSLVPKEQRRQLPDPYKAALAIRKAPMGLLREAIDKGIRGGDEEEFIGSLSVYSDMVTERQEPLHPEYHALLLDRLKGDDFHSHIRTAVLAGTLMLYRSRDTVLAFMDAAARESDPEERTHLVRLAASMLQFDLAISTDTTPLQMERILAGFESWFTANRERIRFDKEGRPTLAGGEAGEGRLELGPDDRKRIRQDPICVLKLIRGMMEGEGEGIPALNAKCGEALLGPEGAALLRQAEGMAGEGDWAPLQLQTAMASARGKYPSMDAVQLAIAYVAAYETDSEARRLARETLDALGASDMDRVLKGEPGEVRRKTKALADEVLKQHGN